MRIGDAIYNLDGLPFRSQESALRMRDLLADESGHCYRLESYPGGGFVLHRHQQQASPAEHSIQNKAVTVNDETQPPSTMAVREYRLRPAVIRANVLSLAMMGIAVAVVLMPEPFLLSVLKLLAVSPQQLGIWWPRLIRVLTLTGSAVLLCLWLALLWQRAGALYRITESGVEARLGLVAYQTLGLRFQDICLMTVQQTAKERCLGIGGVEFRSAGTGGAPVQFYPIAHPAKVLQLVQERMAAVKPIGK
jgi:hypothetical protein